ncbi:MAG: hypothetical protein AABY15_06185 [Nanoarchaeota archaeon]
MKPPIPFHEQETLDQLLLLLWNTADIRRAEAQRINLINYITYLSQRYEVPLEVIDELSRYQRMQ